MRRFFKAWRLVLLQAVGVAAVCYGVALVCVPAALIVAGVVVVLAVERGNL